jgi:putative membrane protein insertion efficiency factor
VTRSAGEMPWTGRSPASWWTHGARGSRWTRWPVALLAAYKRWVSPLLPRSCRFSPTCSEYARVAMLKYGFWRGSARAAARLLRCQPFHPGGIDLP